MKQATSDEERLIRYLLGQMEAEEQALIEERYLADPMFHEELRATERDLIDQYVHGELSEREAFEKSFLSSPARRRRVEFARALMRSPAQAAVVAERRSPQGRPYRAWLPVAAAIVVLVGGWLLVRSGRGVDRPNGSPRTPQHADGRSPAAPSSPGAEPERPGSAPPVRVATLVLSPTLTRDAGETRTLTIGRNTEVHLELQLEADGYDSYRAVLRTPEGEEVWLEERLRSQRSASGEAVVMKVPASRFRSQDYVVRLSGLTAGEVEELGSYYFRVRAR